MNLLGSLPFGGTGFSSLRFQFVDRMNEKEGGY